MTNLALTMIILKGTYAICRLDKQSPIPNWALSGEFLSITRTIDELSIVCRQGNVPEGIKYEKGWRCLKVKGPLDFSLIGILSTLTGVLVREGISVFAVSTYDTDYLLVKEENLEKAVSALRKEGVCFLEKFESENGETGNRGNGERAQIEGETEIYRLNCRISKEDFA